MRLDKYLNELAKGEYDNFIRYLNEGNNGGPVTELGLGVWFSHRTDVNQLLNNLCEILKSNTTVKKLYFSGGCLLDSEGVRLLGEFLKTNKTLESLDLTGNHVGPKGLACISEALKANGALKKLILRTNDLGPDGSRHLSEALKINKTIESLDLSNNDMGSEGSRFVCEALATNRTIKRLDLNINNIDSEGARLVGEALKTNNTLEFLDLSLNKIGLMGAIYISDALTANKALKELVLNVDGFGVEGLKYLSDALKKNKTIESLILDGNMVELNGNKAELEGMEYICDALKVNKTLKVFGLAGVEISSEHVRHLSEVLKVNKTIKDFYLQFNKVGLEGARILAEGLKFNKTLGSLLMYNPIGDLGAKSILQVITSEHQLKYIFFSSNDVRSDVCLKTKAIIAFLKDLGTAESVITSTLPQPIHEELLPQLVYIPESSKIAKIVSDFMPERLALGETLADERQIRNLIEALNTPRPPVVQFSDAISSHKRPSSEKDRSAKKQRISKREEERVVAESQEYFKNQGNPQAKRRRR